MAERTPTFGTPTHDPEQLPLGAFEGAPLLPTGDLALVGPDVEAPAILREPPVCGEWSFDTSSDAESRRGTFVAGQAGQAGEERPPIAAPAPPVAAARTPGSDVRPPVTRPATGAPTRASAPAPAGPAPTRTSRPLRTPLFAKALTPPTPLPALDELKSIHEAHPGDARTAASLANALDKRGNIEGALSVLQRAIDAGADGVEMRCARATILSGRLRYDEAEAELRRASKLRADDPGVLLQQGILACRRAKWRDAVEPLTSVVKLKPVSGAAHYYLGEALNKLDRLKDALDAFERAAALDPANWRALKGAGIVLDRMGRPADAAAFYRRARDAQSGSGSP